MKVSLVELFLVKDEMALLDQIRSYQRVFVDQSILKLTTANTNIYINLMIKNLLKKYFNQVAASKNNYLVEFVRKSAPSAS